MTNPDLRYVGRARWFGRFEKFGWSGWLSGNKKANCLEPWIGISSSDHAAARLVKSATTLKEKMIYHHHQRVVDLPLIWIEPLEIELQFYLQGILQLLWIRTVSLCPLILGHALVTRSQMKVWPHIGGYLNFDKKFWVFFQFQKIEHLGRFSNLDNSEYEQLWSSESYYKMSKPLGAGASDGGPKARKCE